MSDRSQEAVVVDGVAKRFRLYHERNQSLKAAFMRGGRARYEEFWALSDVSFAVETGTTVGLIGHNGSGKSTLLKCLAKILQPDRGSVSIVGKMSALLELGAGFHPELSGRENVYLNGSILGMTRREVDRRFDEIVGFAGIEQFIDMPVKNYSSGMYVRLGFSIATNVDPEVLLIDEVLAVGDENFQRKCLERISELRSEGRTVVLVSHALATVRSLCDEVVWLDRGTVKAHGRASDVADEYLGSVHVELQDEAVHGGGRWGDGSVKITKAEVREVHGEVVNQVATGDDVVFRIHYEADAPVADPVFGLAIYTIDGVHVTGPNTLEAGLDIAEVRGSGHVDLRVDPLLLLSGTYDLSVACVDRTMAHVYDQRHRAFRFDVKPGMPHETMGGILSLNGRWSVPDPGRPE